MLIESMFTSNKNILRDLGLVHLSKKYGNKI